MSHQILQIDTRTAPEEVLRGLHELYLEWDLEWTPAYPPVPWPQRFADWRHLRDQIDVPRWIAIDGDRVIATAGVYHHRTQDTENSFGWTYVSQASRGKGLGRELLMPAVDYAIADGRTRFLTEVPEDSPHHVLAEQAGLKMVYNERVSHVKTADLDQQLLRSWINRAAERASAYEILFLKSPVPDEYRESLVAITEVMNTAPLEDLEEDPFHFSLEELASLEAQEALKGTEILTCVAVHKPTGEFAGYTNVAYQNHHPALAHQWDTGVDPTHRDKGLGRWIKAAMALKLLEDYPAVEIIETENAESNQPMLSINEAMGFTPSVDMKVYQGDIHRLRKFLE